MDLKFVDHSIKVETLLVTINGFSIGMCSKLGQICLAKFVSPNGENWSENGQLPTDISSSA